MLKPAVWIPICACATLWAQSQGTISGRVTADGGQQPLSASITVVTTGPGVRLKSLTTDTRGAFTVEVPPGRVLIVARADGYASEQWELVVIPGRAHPSLNFSLSPAASLSGRVVDQTGAGVAGARLAALPRKRTGVALGRGDW